MMASMVKLVVEGGLPALHCPVTGRVVYEEEEGFVEDAGHSPYLRFFIDWIGQVWLAPAELLPADQAAYIVKINEMFVNPEQDDTQDKIITSCLKVLPPSAVIFEILDPPQGSSDGTICYACFDFAPDAPDEPLNPTLVAEADG